MTRTVWVVVNYDAAKPKDYICGVFSSFEKAQAYIHSEAARAITSADNMYAEESVMDAGYEGQARWLP